MSPGIFFEDFEKTENSITTWCIRSLLVIATRFDLYVRKESKAIKIKEEVILSNYRKNKFNELDTENEIKKLRNEAELIN
ncbi:hypothetical protein [Acinetobacter johnsonii]|uniref:hypothetical protein n=1 Tax=Acinetobacter johnsonii TaxID=40214 RepID=UPI0011E804B0|nr:hypothetical protein [Acinetobacter johnsonii]QEK37760.1 hypothetical protein FYN22_18330 [Acinetobacter johnsonii]